MFYTRLEIRLRGKMATVRVGVIGCGTMGKIHVNAFRKVGAEVAAVCDIDEKEVKYAREVLKIEHVYTDYHDLISRKDIDGVVVVTPNYLHYQMTIDALREGKHVLCEKPPAISAKQVKEMFEASRKYGRKLLIGLTWRFRKLSSILRNYVLKGKIGEPYLIKAYMIRRAGIPGYGSWFTIKEQAGAGPLYDIGVHMLDLSLWIINDFKAKEVLASTYAKLGPKGLGKGTWGKPVPGGPFTVEDWAVAFIKMENGTTTILEAGWAGHISRGDYNVVIMGDKGGINYREASIYSEENGVLVDTKLEVGEEKPVENEARHFVNVILGKEEPLTKPEEMIMLQAILEAALKSAEEKRLVKISEVL
ncbi:MAG: gfo/Idh/MocA family oxidoreductase [Thermoprotei archaeon]|nr:MAG: gfo/Idh/MocA family oxidoreductase [Thermoprotei archaeon]